MKRNTFNITTIRMLSLIFLLCGCEFRPLSEPDLDVKIDVAINVENVSNITTHIYNPDLKVPEIHPEAMHVLFFDVNDSKLVSESFITDAYTTADGKLHFQGGTNILPGVYKMLIYSFGSPHTDILEYRNWDKITAQAQETSDFIKNRFNAMMAASARSSATLMTYTPDHVLVASNEAEVIPYYEGKYTVHTEAKTVVDTYYLQIKVKGLKYVSSARAFLSGMVSANKLSQNVRITDPESTIYFTLEKGKDNGEDVVCALFNTFGRIDNSLNELAVTFDVTTVDGRVVARTFNISDLFLTEEAKKYHWLLLEEVLEIDAPMGSDGGGFQPSVGEWEDEEHDIII